MKLSHRTFLHSTARAAALPAVSRIASALSDARASHWGYGSNPAADHREARRYRGERAIITQGEAW